MTAHNPSMLGAMSASELAQQYTDGALTPVEVAADVIERAAVAQEKFAGVAFLDEDAAMASAEASTERWAAKAPLSVLDGVPVSIKDSIPARGTPWRHGSLVHEPVLSSEDSAPVRRLREAGANIFAKTAMPELGMVASGLSSLYGVVRNPWNPAMSPGGSSSGAGVLLASGVGPLSVGTDLGGSVRSPAAHSGVFGFKPTQGRVPYAPASSVRTPGPLARTVDDLEALLRVIAVADESDLSGLPGRYESAPQRQHLNGIRIAICRHAGAGMPTGDEEWEAVLRQAEVLTEAGAHVTEIPDIGLVPEDQDALLATYRFRVLAELHSVPMARRSQILPELAEFASVAYRMSGLAYAEAMNALDGARERVRRAVYAWDFLMTPVLSVAAFPAEAVGPAGSRSTIDHMQLTAWFNQTGQPAGVIPAGLNSAGLPLGVQIVGKRFQDAEVIALMRLLAERNGVSLTYPFVDVARTEAA